MQYTSSAPQILHPPWKKTAARHGGTMGTGGELEGNTRAVLRLFFVCSSSNLQPILYRQRPVGMKIGVEYLYNGFRPDLLQGKC